jgi:hypothetical protein
VGAAVGTMVGPAVGTGEGAGLAAGAGDALAARATLYERLRISVASTAENTIRGTVATVFRQGYRSPIKLARVRVAYESE